MTTQQLSDETERSRRREFVQETRAAVAQGQTVEQRAAAREGRADEWAQWLHKKMDATGCTDPVALLPDILAKMEQLADRSTGQDRRVQGYFMIRVHLTSRAPAGFSTQRLLSPTMRRCS